MLYMEIERLKYQDIPHKYYSCESGLEYKPVSTVYKCALPEIDWEEKLQKKAKRLGIDPEDLRAQWNKKKDLGTKAGTCVHEDKEKMYLSEFFVELDGELYNPVAYEVDPVIPDTKYQIMDLKQGCMYPELITSLKKDHVRIGGTSDEVFISKENYVHIRDTKTDRAIEYEGFRGQTLVGELSDLQDCNYTAYSLKCSMYMFFILKANPHLKPGTITLLHNPLERDEDGVPVFYDGKPKILGEWEIPVDYQKMEPYVKKLLNHYYKITKPC